MTIRILKTFKMKPTFIFSDKTDIFKYKIKFEMIKGSYWRKAICLSGKTIVVIKTIKYI